VEVKVREITKVWVKRKPEGKREGKSSMAYSPTPLFTPPENREKRKKDSLGC